MKIGIIGAGMIGGTTAKLFADAGHQVALSNSRGPETLAATVDQLGENVHAATVEDAAAFGDIVLVAIPLGHYPTLPADLLAGKIVIDSMNYYPRRDGEIDFGNMSSSEYIAGRLPGARLVKAFNTLYYQILAAEGKPGAPLNERLTLFLAGDDAVAKQTVADLIEQIGFAPLDTGSLHEGGKRQQPDSPIYNRPIPYPEAQRILSEM